MNNRFIPDFSPSGNSTPGLDKLPVTAPIESDKPTFGLIRYSTPSWTVDANPDDEDDVMDEPVYCLLAHLIHW